ncbi:heterokaryon incompatibility protein-domain-containing protein [Ilyonectria sp. MPI-CAGE-AT-0026]|nr:heterokaryon incompatibility protein-domain-containing protein [Ilyonectria sp. MPI-CAGE-AT-0026]
MAPTEKFDYRPFAKPRFIRLLTLYPSTSDTKPLKGRLHQVSLDELKDPKANHSYEALSYVWGAKHGTIPITCDSQTLLITPNCESALRHLRHRFTRRVLWIDAICIDQQSVEEKNGQVPLMGEIYTTAKSVIIWLGSGQPKDEDLLRHARIGGRLYHVRGLETEQILPGQRTRKWVSKFISDEEIETVRRICSNVWFTRIWTVQELLLASSAVFQIGHTECPTAMLYNYLIIAETFAHSESPELQRFQMRNRALETLHPQVSEGKGVFSTHIQRHGRSPETDSTELLAMCWQLAGLSDATDPRDKVYGMCGLLQSILPKEATLPEVDYNKPIAQIFEDATRALIWSTKSLLPLEIIVRQNSEPNDLPSWVPDLRDPTAIRTDWQPSVWRHVSNDTKINIPDYSKLQQKLRERQKALGSSKPVPSVEMVIPEKQEPRQLPAKAKYLAEVVEVYTRMPNVSKGAPDGYLLRTACLSEWTAVAFGLEESQPAEQMPPGGYLNALENLTPALKHIRETNDGPASSSSNGPMKEPRRNQPVDVYDGAVLFRTLCGLLGLCKGHVRVGDRVWQLAGGRYPFVLHRESSPGQSMWERWSVWPQNKVYRLVGTADVPGLESEHRQMVWGKYHEEHFHDIVLV